MKQFKGRGTADTADTGESGRSNYSRLRGSQGSQNYSPMHMHGAWPALARLSATTHAHMHTHTDAPTQAVRAAMSRCRFI